MPIVGAAAIAGGAALYSAHKQSSSADKANKAQQGAQNEALAYEKQKDAEAKARYDEAKARYDFSQQQAWKMKQGVLSRYGIHLPDMPQYQGQGGQPGPQRAPVSLGTIARAVPQTPSAMTIGGLPPGAAPAPHPDASNWDDWRQYA